MFYKRLVFRVSSGLSSKIIKTRGYCSAMNNLYLLHVENSDRFDVSFEFCQNEPQIRRQFRLKRPLTESIEVFLSRLNTNVDKVMTRKIKRKKKDKDVEDVKIDLDVKLSESNLGEVPGHFTCKDVFFNGPKNLFLTILNTDYKIIVNPPWVSSLSLPQNLMVDSYAYPYKLDILFGSREDSVFTWYKSDESGGNWTKVSSGTILQVAKDHVQCKLKLTCTPRDKGRSGPEVEAVTNCVIKPAPENIPFVQRHSFTKEVLPNGSFRVVTYNILAEVYAESATAKRDLFPYCPEYALAVDYRKQLYIRELLGYNADIICLQECDARVFHNDLSSILGDRAFKGVLTRKNGSVAEGVATFYSTAKFRLVEEKLMIFSQEIDTNPIFSKIWDTVKKNEAVVDNLKARTNVFHALVLQTAEGELVVVGNTHLFFYPSADHIRLIQAAMMVYYLADLVERLKVQGKKVGLVVCGDMNSTPDCGLFQLMTSGRAAPDLPDWTSDKAEPLEGMELSQPFEMASAYGAPPYTNFTVNFAGCLDYIYYQTDVFTLIQKVPLPADDVVRAHTALPSPLFPSDHMALVADFSWK